MIQLTLHKEQKRFLDWLSLYHRMYLNNDTVDIITNTISNGGYWKDGHIDVELNRLRRSYLVEYKIYTKSKGV